MTLYGEKMFAVLTHDGDLTEWFKVLSGIWQGPILSLVLFTKLIDFILQTCIFMGDI